MTTSVEVKTSLSLKEYTLLLVSTLTVMAGATIAPALPEIAKAFPEEDELTIQLILTMPALFAAFGSLFVSTLIEKFGRIRLLTISIITYGIAGSSGLYLEDIALLLVGRAILGLSVAAIMTTATTLIGDYYHGEFREKIIGMQAAFMTFAAVVFISLGGVLA
ncbi:MAG: MFS transporter, partial [Candidatus Heimdallarchaeota archaeon]|nr:MFS transporter [Candidatus Heimdallarchaeota archaeon]